MKRAWLVVTPVVALALTACGSNKPEGCASAPRPVIQAIVNGQSSSGLELSSARVIKGTDVYYVAAKYDIAGDSGKAVWATTQLDGSSPIRSAEALSAALTKWPRVAGIDAGAQPVQDALACLD